MWLCYNSQGGITYREAYHMPITMRNFNIKWISERIKQHNEEIEKANGKGTTLSMEDLAKRKEQMPDFVTPKATTKK